MTAIYGGGPRKIEAIKLVRDATRCGLAEAKDFVERTQAELYAEHPERFAAPPTVVEPVRGALVLIGVALLVIVVVALIVHFL
ncbi:MAG: ribosomal protein L7/L12 [Verrucomicrobia bacterium]|nr:ribosomal protein L7/L12 [Verrucomicrobiota bacterium]